MLNPMMRQLAGWAYEAKIKADVEMDDNGEQTIDFNAWQAKIFFGGDGRANASPVFTEPEGKRLLIIYLQSFTSARDWNPFLLGFNIL